MMIIDNDKEPAFFTKISGVVRSKLLEEGVSGFLVLLYNLTESTP